MDLCKKDTKWTVHRSAVSKFGQCVGLKVLLIEVSFDKPSQIDIAALTEIYGDKHVEVEKEWNTDQAKSNSIRLSNEA